MTEEERHMANLVESRKMVKGFPQKLSLYELEDAWWAA
jgi:hypothetical protein